MFGCYCIINVTVLLNLLIAMMNHSYQIISVRTLFDYFLPQRILSHFRKQYFVLFPHLLRFIFGPNEGKSPYPSSYTPAAVP